MDQEGIEDFEPEMVAAWIKERAPDGITVLVDRIGPSAVFDSAEEKAVARAVATRRDEFATGRRLARGALARLGCVAGSLPPDPDRVPQWPEGYLGTISHAGGLCVALAGRSRDFIGIGVDIEENTRILSELTPLICRPDEVDVSGSKTVDDTLARFVAKEAFFKAYFPATRNFIDFQSVRVELNVLDEQFEVQLMEPSSPSLGGARKFAGRIATVGNYIVAGVWVPR